MTKNKGIVEYLAIDFTSLKSTVKANGEEKSMALMKNSESDASDISR
ncbi:hypothetical protein BTN50_1449 [Candidatus Enterovibrio altilux]|uniref:Uncharacterized protein n=1 Tax=Candidatus Enterovibrio altilux TaxID=1927128 RepID=A0A291BAB5_9GAMM|nr:hypothetical protein BTN50_1449 [Candidatus Enterovibrio luxaltus]